MATGSLYGSVSESTGLYGIGAASGGTYFEWFIFQDSATAPATPTGGSWSFTNNTGTAPSGWVVSPPPAPVNQVWVSIAVVDSRNATTLTWSVPGLMTGSGLPILTGAGVPSSGTGLNGQLYINTSTTPQSLYNKQAGAWVQLTGSTLYALAGANANITSLTGITGGISTPTFLQLSTAGSTDAVGKLHWNTTFGGPTIGLAGGNTNLQIGQDEFVYVHNNTGATITKGQVVYVSGSQGQRLTVGLARANADATSISVLGFANESIANNADGFIATSGLVSGINTSGFADGVSIWLSPTIAGGFTVTKPVAPNHLVLLGYVVKGGSVSAGSIYVFTQNGYELDELHDVLITSVANNNLLRYNSAVPAWVNIAGPTGTIVGTTDTQTLTNKSISGSANTLTNIPNAALVNSSININSVNFTLGAVQTIGADWILPSYAGNAGKVLALNPSASDVEWISAGGVGTVTSVNVSGGTTGLTTSGGPVTAAGTITLGGTLSLLNGGTGQTTANAAFNALVPLQTGNSGRYLTTDGTNTSWAVNPLGTVTSVSGTGTVNGLTLTGTVTTSGSLTLGGTLNLSAPPAIGNTTASSGAFTTLSASGDVTISGGTANGVAYLNGSKVLTTGSALTFDGTSSVGLGIASPLLLAAGRGNITINGSSDSIVVFGNNGLRSGYIYSSSTKLEFDAADNRWIQWNTNGTEQMRLTTTGLGIGTSSPAAKLSFGNYIPSDGQTVHVYQSGTVRSGLGVVAGSYRIFTNTTSAVSFGQVSESDGSTYTERMRLDSSGNLGLGVTPSAWGSDYKAMQIGAELSLWSGIGGGAGFNGMGSNFYIDTAGNPAYIRSSFATNYQQNRASGIHAWYTAPSGTTGGAISFSQVMTLDASGNLGIGTSSPGQKLHVDNSANSSTWIKVSNGSNGAGAAAGVLFGNDGGDLGAMSLLSSANSPANSLFLRTLSTNPLVFGTNNTERMRLDSSGNLGIGTSSPATKLEVYNATNADQYWRTSAISLYAQVNNTNGTALFGTLTNHPLTFWTNSAERMRLDSSGNLLVGKTSGYRSGKFVVAAANVSQISTLANVHITTTDTQAANIGGSLGLGGLVGGGDETPFVVISGRKENGVSGNYAGYLAFATQASSASMDERARIDSFGNLLVGTTSSTGVTVAAFKRTGDALIEISANNGTPGTDSLAIGQAGTNDAYVYQRANKPLIFGTNNTERARIDSSGNLLVGTTSATSRTGVTAKTVSFAGSQDAAYVTANDNSFFAVCSHIRTTSGTRYHIGFGDGTAWTERGTISTNGTSTSYNTSSDYRLKNITGPITTSGAYIDSLNPVEGTWKADGSTFVGLIAHEVQEASRTPVATGVKDGEKMQGMDYSSAEIIANLIAEVKSLRARLAAANI